MGGVAVDAAPFKVRSRSTVREVKRELEIE
jgi:hypothetical protein